MTPNRYNNDNQLSSGKQLGVAQSVLDLRTAIKNGTIQIVRTFTTSGDDRLDVLAGNIYGDSRYWWVLAAASNIGWGLQVPSGTIINVVSLDDVNEVIG